MGHSSRHPCHVCEWESGSDDDEALLRTFEGLTTDNRPTNRHSYLPISQGIISFINHNPKRDMIILRHHLSTSLSHLPTVLLPMFFLSLDLDSLIPSASRPPALADIAADETEKLQKQQLILLLVWLVRLSVLVKNDPSPIGPQLVLLSFKC